MTVNIPILSALSCTFCGAGQSLPRLMTTTDIMREIGCVRATVSLAVREGRLVPAGKLGANSSAWLFTEAAVRAWRSSPSAHRVGWRQEL